MTYVQRDPYGQALGALRRFTLDGRFGWGQPLVVKDLAEEIGLSHTPVREALACLAGEGLIERRRGKGYFFPALTGPDVIDLFDLDWSYVHSALTLHAPRTVTLQKLGGRPAPPDFPTLYRDFVLQTGNEALIAAYDRLLERLLPVQRAEVALDCRYVPSAADLAAAAARADHGAVLEIIARHHAQRCAEAAALARHLQRSGGGRSWM